MTSKIESPQACKHDIDWDEAEEVSRDGKEVIFSVGCKECYQEWHVFYKLDSIYQVPEDRTKQYVIEPDLDFEVFPK